VILADVNVLVHAFRADSLSLEHETCRAWLEGIVNGDTRYGTSRQVLDMSLIE
jgi:predicted nucleic acid-binding protein